MTKPEIKFLTPNLDEYKFARGIGSPLATSIVESLQADIAFNVRMAEASVVNLVPSKYIPSEALVCAIRSLIDRARDEGCDEAACIVAEEWLKAHTT